MQYLRHKINVTEINIKREEYGHILVMTHSNSDGHVLMVTLDGHHLLM